MLCKLYQYPTYHPDNETEFAACIKRAGNKRMPKIKSHHYELKFMGLINCNTPEEAFLYLRKVRHPLNYGNPIIESDVIVTQDGAFAFTKSGVLPVTFDEAKAKEKRNLIRAVAILPGLPAFETRVNSNDRDFFDFFGGDSDYIVLEHDLCIYYHSGANAAFFNRFFPHSYDYRVINGPCIITKDWFSPRSTLTDEEVQYCLTRFSTPVFSKGLIFGLFGGGYCSYDKMSPDPPYEFDFPEIGDAR